MKINRTILLIAATTLALTACEKRQQGGSSEIASPVSVTEVSKSSISTAAHSPLGSFHRLHIRSASGWMTSPTHHAIRKGSRIEKA